MRRSELVIVRGSRGGRGRPKVTWNEIVNKDLIALNLSKEIAHDRVNWRKRIHIADPT